MFFVTEFDTCNDKRFLRIFMNSSKADVSLRDDYGPQTEEMLPFMNVALKSCAFVNSHF